MKNMIMLYESVMSTVELVGNTMKGFCEKYGGSFRETDIRTITERDIERADVILCVRGESPLMLGCLRYAKSKGKKRIFFLDDDLKDMPKGSFRYPERTKWLVKCMAQCEVLLTTNQLIADEYQDYMEEKRTAVVNIDVDEEEINDVSIEDDDNHIKIVYAAGERHIVFFEKYVRPVMDTLYDKYDERLEFYFIGLKPDFSGKKYRKQIHCIPGMSYGQYAEYMKKTRFDIGLAPLESNHFTERKYFNKFLEYAKNGTCGIYSKCMPYQLVVDDGTNGYLADNDPADWYKTICRAIENREERITCIKNSQAYIRQYHNKEVIYQNLAEDIPELLNYTHYDRKKYGNQGKIQYRFRHKIFRVIERIYLTMFSLFHYGFRYTLKRICNKMNVGVIISRFRKMRV